MFRPLVTVSAAAALLFSFSPIHIEAAKAQDAATPIVVLETEGGDIEIETFPDEAPISVAHFVALAKKGFYRGQRFHWVQPALVQAGDPNSRDITKQKLWGTGGSGPGRSNKPLGVAEFSTRKFVRGIVGLAYRLEWKAETADSMFFILRGDNPALNGKYVALGKVIKGINIVDKVAMNDIIKNVTVR
ncbi:MAG: peptidylprolyl isomerase [Acidobacteria bacterium]|jgi:cyclophilin family peptidyl-prolyl cis-trans isomerase|nr:peptidylprolyl isomerase [Acidobacteriota bacterium]